MKDENLKVLIGANIKREREKTGLTQERLAELIGIGPKSLSAAERGAVGVSLGTLKKICSVLSISSDSILFGGRPRNDVQDLTERLERLPPHQCKIACEILYKLLEAFGQEDPAQRP